MKKESIKKLKDAIPYLIVAQTVMLGTITVATIVGSLSKTAFGCRIVSNGTVICVQQKQEKIMLEFDLTMEDYTIILNALHYYKKVDKKGNFKQYDEKKINDLRDRMAKQVTNYFG